MKSFILQSFNERLIVLLYVCLIVHLRYFVFDYKYNNFKSNSFVGKGIMDGANALEINYWKANLILCLLLYRYF